MNKQNDKIIYCACLRNNGKCEGKCREVNLYRKRTNLETCPAAYEPKDR